VSVDELIDFYRQMKAKVSEIETRHAKELEGYKTVMLRLEGMIDQFLTDNGLVNVKTKYGTAYWKTKWSAALVDPDAFMQFVRENDRWDLMDRKANVVAVREYAKLQKELPPGAKLDSRRTVHIVKAGASIPNDE